jgi:hypothetical protein
MSEKLYKQTLQPMLDEDGEQMVNADGYPLQQEVRVELTPEEYTQRAADEQAVRDELPGKLIKQSRLIASGKIDAIAPLYKQMNLIRENQLSDPIFAEIDAVRVKSNSIEDMIKSSTYEQLTTFNLATAWK